ncbi:MAG: hypothetical protein IJG80_02990 [Selenomonadaceae bacterium]|nr:hypothetical protein [Selenomonadaceae bacterium]MBQ3727382.1 hypothetical protein [Selenomonadaceae bacterium]
MIERVVLVGLKKFFRLMNQLSLCLSKEKVAKRKDPSQGRLLSRELKVALTRSVELRWTPLSCGVCSAAVIHDGL